MDSEQPLTINDFSDIDEQLKKDSSIFSNKKKLFLILGICFLFIIIIAIIVIILLGSSDNNKENQKDEKASKDKSYITCNFDISENLNISILNEEFIKPKFFDILVNDKPIEFSRYYKFETSGQKEIKYIFYGDFSMDCMFKDISELISVNMTTEKSVAISSMKSAFESCTNLENFDIHGFNLNNLVSINKIFYGTKISNIDMKEFNIEKTEDLSYLILKM